MTRRQSMSPWRCDESGETMAHADRLFRIDATTDSLLPLPASVTSPRDKFLRRRRRANSTVSFWRRRTVGDRSVDAASDWSLSELGRGDAWRMISLTRLMSASTSPVVLTICGSLPILLSLSAATVSIVRLITG